MIILGIETSCDETGAAIIRAEHESVTLLANCIATSLALHAETGGIIPERAAREQLRYILPVITQALTEAEMTIDQIDAIAVTYGPGLIGSLLVGVETAKTLAYAWDKPLIPVNHMYGHIYANWIVDAQGIEHRAKGNSEANRPSVISFPALALVVSGGHTDLVLMKEHGDLRVIGGTRDDAAGEAFDKIGRLLGLPYPAGPVISKLAEQGDPKAFPLPRPMIGSGDYDFSFSGLKTAVLNLTKKHNWDFSSVILEEVKRPTRLAQAPAERVESHSGDPIASLQGDKKQLLCDLCASVETAIIDTLVRKTLKAAAEFNVKSILLGGGVAANTKLRQTILQKANDQRLMTRIFVPQKSLCTDNAAMIAAAAYYNYEPLSWQDIIANPELYY